jgi:hypothetical protein
MKKAHVLGLAMFAVLAFSVTAVASASAATILWLASGVAIGTAEPVTSTGEIELRNLKDALGQEIAVLCSGVFDGTVGPGAEDLITTVLNLGTGGTEISLAKKITTCTNLMGCTKPELTPENLPWLTELELMEVGGTVLFLNIITSGGKGEPGYTVHCEVLNFPVEETCLGSVSANLTNDASEGDVLAVFEKEETGVCEGKTPATGEVNSGAGDEEGLITLNSGLTLEISYE